MRYKWKNDLLPEIYKNDMSGNTAAMCMWVGGNKPRVVKKYTFEPCYRDDSNPYNRLRGDSDILKSGEKIRFYWFGGYKEFTVPELKDTKVCSVKLYIGQWGARDTGINSSREIISVGFPSASTM